MHTEIGTIIALITFCLLAFLAASLPLLEILKLRREVQLLHRVNRALSAENDEQVAKLRGVADLCAQQAEALQACAKLLDGKRDHPEEHVWTTAANRVRAAGFLPAKETPDA